MNELIKELVRQYCPNGEPNLSRNQFAEAIQTACKAQRNACARVWQAEYYRHKNTDSIIKNAEITRQDYENIPN